MRFFLTRVLTNHTRPKLNIQYIVLAVALYDRIVIDLSLSESLHCCEGGGVGMNLEWEI